MFERRFAWLGLGGFALALGACELIGGLSDYDVAGSTSTGSGGTGGKTSSASSTGGATTSTSGSGGATTSTSGSGGCDGGLPGCANACTANDPMNCGWCGHACGAGVVCKNEMCEPTPVDSPYTDVSAIGASPKLSGVYWAGDHAGAYELGGTNTSGMVPKATTPVSVGGLAPSADGSEVYYTDATGLHVWATLANGGTSLLSAVAHLSPGPVATIGNPTTSVGWMSADTLYVTSLFPATMTTPFTPSKPGVLAVDDPSLWTFDTSMLRLSSVDATNVTSSTKFGPMVVDTVDFLAVDGQPAGYFYAIWGGRLHRVQKQDTTWLAPAADPLIASPAGLVLSPDGLHVYWLDAGTTCAASDGQLGRLGWDDAALTLVANHLACPAYLTQDVDNLYFTEGAPGQATPGTVTIMAVAR